MFSMINVTCYYPKFMDRSIYSSINLYSSNLLTEIEGEAPNHIRIYIYTHYRYCIIYMILHTYIYIQIS